MWQRFTERARRVVFFAQEEAGRCGENYVSTEHLLLGLIREHDSVSSRILDGMGIPLSRIRSELERLMTRGDGRLGQDMQLTPRSKRSIDLAYDEARMLHNDYIGTEHLLLGLIRESEGLAGRVLAKVGVDLERTRTVVRSLQDGATPRAPILQSNEPGAPPEEPAGDEPAELPPSLQSTPAEPALESGRVDADAALLTRRGRRIVSYAHSEARRLGEQFVSTEHLLLGLIADADNIALRVLNRIGIAPQSIRAELDRRVLLGERTTAEPVTLTPRAKRALNLSYEEARGLGCSYVGTEHLLLGLIREGEGLAARVLKKVGADLQRVRAAIAALTDADTLDSAPPGQYGDIETADPDEPYGLRQTLIQRAVPEPEIDSIIAAVAAIYDRECTWRGRSLVTLADATREQFRMALDAAKGVKALHLARMRTIAWTYPRTLGMIFEKPSLRTRVSFEAGMAHLGGHAIYLAPGDIGLGTREPAEDVARALSRWVDVISARVFKHETVIALAQNASVPVINALSDVEHPVQAFADLLTLEEHRGRLGNGVKLAYIGDGNNMLHALLLACAKMGVNLSAACPDGYRPDGKYVEAAAAGAIETGAQIQLCADPAEAAAGADAVYTDVWTSMGQEAEQQDRRAIFQPYQINSALMAHAKPDAIVLHCLPAHCGEEISEEVYEAHKTVIMDQAENRMHTQKALIALILGM